MLAACARLHTLLTSAALARTRCKQRPAQAQGSWTAAARPGLSEDARQRGAVKETRLCMTSKPLFCRGRNFQLQKRRVALAANSAHGPRVGDYKYTGSPLGLSPFWSLCTPLAASLNSPAPPHAANRKHCFPPARSLIRDSGLIVCLPARIFTLYEVEEHFATGASPIRLRQPIRAASTQTQLSTTLAKGLLASLLVSPTTTVHH